MQFSQLGGQLYFADLNDLYCFYARFYFIFVDLY